MKLFKHIFLFLLISSSGLSLANANGTFYLVRHAEKQSDGSKDPHLTEQGQQRAEYLAQQLSLANITKIYSTEYHRTQETAKPLADLLGIEVEAYNPGNLEAFAEALKTQTGKIVVVGHSNTTPKLTALLSGAVVEPIDEGEYDNLYQVVLIGGKAQLNRFRIFPIDSIQLVESKAVESGSP